MDRVWSECNCGSSSDTSLHRRSDCVTTEKFKSCVTKPRLVFPRGSTFRSHAVFIIMVMD